MVMIIRRLLIAVPLVGILLPICAICAQSSMQDQRDGSHLLAGSATVTTTPKLLSSLTQISACPMGQTCYYFSSSTGNDSTGAGTLASPGRASAKP